jgi:hypothetical protein
MSDLYLIHFADLSTVSSKSINANEMSMSKLAQWECRVSEAVKSRAHTIYSSPSSHFLNNGDFSVLTITSS